MGLGQHYRIGDDCGPLKLLLRCIQYDPYSGLHQKQHKPISHKG